MSVKNFSYVIVMLSAVLFSTPLFADLEQYVSRPEPEFSWSLKEKIRVEQTGDLIYDLGFVSQVWQGNKWEHQLQIYVPRDSGRNSTTMFIWVTGGSATPSYIDLGLSLARKIGAPVAFLYNIPNQPLLENNLREDDLIAESFVRYLKTKDENWPLLFPMVKSVVKAMDVLQEAGSREFKSAPVNFIVSGASKRGWTTWLTAATDKRVTAIAPVVIDTLNLREQMPRQLKAFGAYSSRLTPYTSRGLVPIPETTQGQRLLRMVDPWSYRERLTMPKLIINGTNDSYWATDALNVYWNDLPDKKWVIYVPNAGHDLQRQDVPYQERLSDLINGLAAFAKYQISGRALPDFTWKYDVADGRLRLTIDARPQPIGGRIWVAETSGRDFRTAQWRHEPLRLADGKLVGGVQLPETGHLAMYGELDYEIDNVTYHLTTQVKVSD
jgi:PhoPQ-activated pathogenicity-related protein